MEVLFGVFLFFVYSCFGNCQVKITPSYRQPATVEIDIGQLPQVIQDQPNWKHISLINQKKNGTSVSYNKYQPTKETRKVNISLEMRHDNHFPVNFQEKTNTKDNENREQNHKETWNYYNHPFARRNLYDWNSQTEHDAISHGQFPHANGLGENLYQNEGGSSYTVYDKTENIPLVHDQFSDIASERQGSFQGPLNETEILALQIEEYLLHKEKYFYHKGKIISNLVIALYAFGLALIWITVGVATYIANQVNGRRKRDLQESLSGSDHNFSNSLTCVAKFMCELQRREDLFGRLNRRKRLLERARHSECSEQVKEQPHGQRRSQRRRNCRQLSYQQNCNTVYENCSINFSLLLGLWKMIFK